MFSFVARYKEENRVARDRLLAGSQLINTSMGVIEAAVTGQGSAVLISARQRRWLRHGTLAGRFNRRAIPVYCPIAFRVFAITSTTQSITRNASRYLCGVT